MAVNPRDDVAFGRGGDVGEKHSATIHLLGGSTVKVEELGPLSYLETIVAKWSRVYHEVLARVEYHDQPKEAGPGKAPGR